MDHSIPGNKLIKHISILQHSAKINLKNILPSRILSVIQANTPFPPSFFHPSSHILITIHYLYGKFFHLQTYLGTMEKLLTTLDVYIIESVKRQREIMRIKPSQLSLEIGLNRNFISRIEGMKYGEKYTLYQLNEIAKVLKCKFADFLPDPPLEEDCIEEYHLVREEKARRNKRAKRESEK